MNIRVRDERPADFERIAEVLRRAFAGEIESRLVDDLRAGGFDRLAQVAEVDGSVVGHIMYSPLVIHTSAGPVEALALAPMAVLPDLQNHGIGSALVRHSLERCRELGHRIVVVLGHRDYYPRFGFSADLARPLSAPWSGESFMALELVPGALSSIEGRVQYAKPFEAFE